MPFPTECCYAMEFLRLLQVRNAAGCSRNIQCAVRMLESYHKEVVNENIFKIYVRTLIASVRIAAMTSSDPPNTRLPSSDGSYSQIVVAFSTTAIFVMCFITSTFARLMTCPRHLDRISKYMYIKRSTNKTHGSCNFLLSHFENPRRACIFSMV